MTRPNTLRESQLGEHVRAYSKRSSTARPGILPRAQLEKASDPRS